MIQDLINNAVKYQMENNFDRIYSGKKLDINRKPYTSELLYNMISYFEETEEYEKCIKITEFKRDYNDHNKNYCII